MTAQPRASLTERRKADTRMEIARTAARLFAERGAAATTAETIAREAGVGLRTFYRYCRTKEDAVEPLLADGARRWLADVSSLPPGRLPEAAELSAAAVRALSPGGDADKQNLLETTRGLIAAAEDDAALRALWQRINLEGEQQLREVLAERAGRDVEPLRVRLLAAAASAAIRIAVEAWAADPHAPGEGPGSPADLVVRCMRELTAGAERAGA